jgi:hypothetical protein
VSEKWVQLELPFPVPLKAKAKPSEKEALELVNDCWKEWADVAEGKYTCRACKTTFPSIQKYEAHLHSSRGRK